MSSKTKLDFMTSKFISMKHSLLCLMLVAPLVCVARNTNAAPVSTLNAPGVAASAATPSELMPALDRLTKDADKALKLKPLSVMDKKLMPDSGDKHDYMSIAPYLWPNPDTPDGMPYVRRDGKVNPEYHSDATDFDSFSKTVSAIETLTLAYHYTGNENYASHAARLVRVWFLDPQTRMNPSVKFGQAVPGQSAGRPAGFIETAKMQSMVAALPLLESSPSWTAGDKRAMQKWLGDFVDWALASEIGQQEGRSNNNHGTWFDVQIARFALYADQPDIARQILERVPAQRIDRQIKADGEQPAELKRTKSWNYSNMNLRAFFELAMMADDMGIDLWNYKGKAGQSLRAALDFIAPYADPANKWPYEQIANMDMSASILPLLRHAAHYYHEPRYEALIAKIADDDITDDRLQLLFPSEKSQ